MKIKRLAIILAAAAVALTAACSGGDASDSGGTPDAQTDSGGSVLTSGVSGDTVVARPTNGAEGMEITFDSFIKEYRYYLAGYGMTDDVNTLYADMFRQRREYIIDYLIEEKILETKFSELGLELTEEDTRQIEQVTADNVAEIKQSIQSGLDRSDNPSEEELGRRTDEFFNNMLESCGITMDDLLYWQRSDTIRQKIADHITSDLTISDSEVEEQLQSAIESAKNAYETAPSSFDGEGYAGVWLPEGSRRIKHILIKFSDADISEILTLRSGGNNEEADALRSEKLADLEETVNTVRGEIESGADFEELMNTYSGDGDTTASYIITPGTGRFTEGFAECALDIPEVGGISECVSDYGFHFIKYVSEAAVTEDTLQVTSENIRRYLTEAYRSRELSNRMTEWRSEYGYEIDSGILFIDSQTETTE